MKDMKEIMLDILRRDGLINNHEYEKVLKMIKEPKHNKNNGI